MPPGTGEQRNAAYNWFSADCQNFVSQCVHAGGILLQPPHNVRG
ncbi:MAG: amidase domain-containing protein [Bacillota bacterium]|nr:amidase domain-containing protein [Bacillota bacterium]